MFLLNLFRRFYFTNWSLRSIRLANVMKVSFKVLKLVTPTLNWSPLLCFAYLYHHSFF